MIKKMSLIGFLAFAAMDAVAMDNEDFRSLLASVEAGSFSDDKLAVVESAASDNLFSCSQVKTLLGRFSFSEDKLKALTAVRDSIEDPQRKHVILEAFSFSEDKQNAKNILSQARPFQPGAEPVAVTPGGTGLSTCGCYVLCANGDEDVISIPREGTASYMDVGCQQKGMAFCGSTQSMVRKAELACD